MKFIKFLLLLISICNHFGLRSNDPTTDRIMETNGYTGSNINKNANTSATQNLNDVDQTAKDQRYDEGARRTGQSNADFDVESTERRRN